MSNKQILVDGHGGESKIHDRRLLVDTKHGDTTDVDAFGRLRVSNPISLFDNKNIHDRHKNQWEEPIVGAIITYENLVGVFQVAETITGGTSGTTGTVTAVNGGSVTITYIVNHDDFAVGEEITGGTSGATAEGKGFQNLAYQN